MDIQIYVGADIAADHIQLDWQDSANRPHHQMTLKQQPRDYARWVKQLTQQTAPEHVQVVLEATGNYWMAFAEYLHQAGMVVSVLNPFKPNTSPRPNCNALKRIGWMLSCCASMGGGCNQRPGNRHRLSANKCNNISIAAMT